MNLNGKLMIATIVIIIILCWDDNTKRLLKSYSQFAKE